MESTYLLIPPWCHQSYSFPESNPDNIQNEEKADDKPTKARNIFFSETQNGKSELFYVVRLINRLR